VREAPKVERQSVKVELAFLSTADVGTVDMEELLVLMVAGEREARGTPKRGVTLVQPFEQKLVSLTEELEALRILLKKEVLVRLVEGRPLQQLVDQTGRLQQIQIQVHV